MQVKNISNIKFHNEPKLSEHEVDSKFNERRLYLVPYVKAFISTNPRFKSKEVSVTFAHAGISSLVSIVETNDEKFVLKIPLKLTNPKGEAQFLKTWEQAGVKVSHVIEEGKLGGHYYLLLEYVDTPILSELYSDKELVEKGTYFEMGETLRLMHIPRAKGYGRVIDGKAEYSEFKDWFLGERMQKRIKYVEENKLLRSEHGSVSIAFEILLSHVSKNSESSYCHNDFGLSNIFDTHPITVFDPDPRFNNGYIDLGLTLAYRIAHSGSPEALEQLINGYFGDKSYDKKVLHASVLLNIYRKLPYWNRTKKSKNIKNVQEYLVKNVHLLEK